MNRMAIGDIEIVMLQRQHIMFTRQTARQMAANKPRHAGNKNFHRPDCKSCRPSHQEWFEEFEMEGIDLNDFNVWNDLNDWNLWNFFLQREAREEIPHFPIGVDDVGRRAEETLHDLLLAAGPDMAGAGEFP